MNTRSGKNVPHTDQRRIRALQQPEGTQVEATASIMGEGTSQLHARPPQEPASSSPALPERHNPSSTPPAHVPTVPPKASPLRKQQRIGNPGIVGVWEDVGLVCRPESEPSVEGLDLFAYSALPNGPATQRRGGRQLQQRTVGPTGTIIVAEPEDERRAFKRPQAHPTQIQAGQPSDQSPSPPDGIPLGPNGTHLVDLEKAWLGPNGTHLIR